MTFCVVGYVVLATATYLALETLTDRFWPVTLLAFGPRWLFALPLPFLAVAVPVLTRARRARPLLLSLAGAGLIVLFGIMDFRLGIGRAADTPHVRLMTHNMGTSRATPQALDHLLRSENVDVATIQECGIQADDMIRFGWHARNDYNQCVISRYPLAVVDMRSPMDMWQLGGGGGISRYELETPRGRLSLETVHLETIREGIEGFLARRPTVLRDFAANRDQRRLESHIARAWSRRGAGGLVVAGDFNMPIESAVYRESWADLANAFSRCGRGFGHTKKTRWFSVRIDHILMSEAWNCADARVLPQPFRGDHRPLVVDLVPR